LEVEEPWENGKNPQHHPDARLYVPPPRAVRPTTGRAPHDGRPDASSLLRYDLFWTSVWAWIFIFWASFAALLASTSFSLDSTHTFILKTWLESYKSTINTQQAKTSVIGEIGA